ncbi:Structural maintenance of chromosomes protein 2-1 [Orobanche hederae]
MSRTHFPHSQFIVISLKKSMFNNATVTVQRVTITKAVDS